MLFKKKRISWKTPIGIGQKSLVAKLLISKYVLKCIFFVLQMAILSSPILDQKTSGGHRAIRAVGWLPGAD